MSDLTPARALVQTQEVEFRAAVSESLMQKMGAMSNFIGTYQKYDKQFFINGAYYVLTTPYSAIDGLTWVPDNAVVTNAFMFVHLAGSSGATTLDIKYATSPGGAWTSIFSTKPSINYQAGNFSFCYTGSAFSFTTAPVLSTTTFSAGTVFRCDLTASQGGSPQGCGLILSMRPN